MKRHIPPRMLVLTALFAGLTAAGAFLRIPTPWSAFTLQVLFVYRYRTQLSQSSGHPHGPRLRA